MDLVLKGRGIRVTEHMRRVVAQKLAKLQRLDPRAVRVEVELTAEANPRQDGRKRAEAALDIPRHTFRAHAEASEIDAAVDRLVDRLERQIRDHHGRKRNRALSGANRLKSARISPEGTGTAG
jgi:ribosomal subunit interface protein